MKLVVAGIAMRLRIYFMTITMNTLAKMSPVLGFIYHWLLYHTLSILNRVHHFETFMTSGIIHKGKLLFGTLFYLLVPKR